jgi:hypothetical protein
MTSKIKVDNIENQCGGAVVTKCGGTTTIAGTNVNATTVTATNVVGNTAVKSNAIQASDGGNLVSQCGTTITLGASGDTINLASGASQSGFGRTGTVDWDTTPKTATFSAVSGDGYFCNTSGGAFTVNLPAGSAGAIVSLADYAATWQTNNVIVAPNGTDKIGSLNLTATLDTEGQSVTFVYVDSTQGWINTMDSTSNVRGSPLFIIATGGTITTSGNDKIHTFTGPGNFCVSQVSTCAPSNIVSYMTVAGGGGGSADGTQPQGGGGGGAGGFREVKSPVTPYTASPLDGYPSSPNRITATVTNFPIVVGGGGAGSSGRGSPGSVSTFSTITSAGGGTGGVYSGNPGDAGGSGGGGGGNGGGGGAGNTPPTTPSQGNAGSNYVGNNPGAGGGASAAGSGQNGGAGIVTSINASPITRAGGGAAGYPGGSNGPGGGGDRAVPGSTNTGGGGGGNNSPGGGGNGGSGIVVIRYKFQ